MELKYKEITEKIIGASFEVHNFLGNGFQEVIYQRALAYEMRENGLSFARELEQPIFYKELEEPIGTRRADFFFRRHASAADTMGPAVEWWNAWLGKKKWEEEGCLLRD